MTDSLREFASRHGLDAAGLAERVARGHWPTVAGWLRDHGADPAAMTRGDLILITEAVAACLPMPVRAAPKAPATAQAPSAPAATERIRAILEHPEAQGERQQAARHIAFKTAMSPADAVAALRMMGAATQAPVAAAPARRFVESAMPPTVSLVPVRPDQAIAPLEESARASWDAALDKVNGATP